MISFPRNAFVLVALAIGACAVDGSAGPQTSQPISTTHQTTTLPGGPACPNPDGGVCLGQVDGGTYTTESFSPAITYTIPDGWSNLEDLPGNFLLEKPGDTRYLGIYQNVRAPAECEEEWVESVGGSVDDLVAWYTTHPGLVTSEPEQVTVGGLNGVFLDISLDPSWDVTCSYSEGQPIVPFIIGNGTSQVHHVILPGFEERLYLLEWEGGNVAIEVGTEGTDLSGYLSEVLPIIENLAFAVDQ